MKQGILILLNAYFPETPQVSIKEHYIKSAGKLAEVIDGMPEEYNIAFKYHEARLLAMGGQVSEAIEIINDLLNKNIYLPEALWLMIQLTASDTSKDGNKLRWKLEDQLGKILPISFWGRQRDNKLEEEEIMRKGGLFSDGPDWPQVPDPTSQKLLQIARLFDQMNMHAEAANAYREAIYGTFDPPGFPQFGSETWISGETADAWFSVARHEMSIGINKWAFQALPMAVVASPDLKDKTDELLHDMLNDTKVKSRPAPELEKLNQIAILYRDSNLHPRAIHVLNTAEKVLGADVSQLRNKIANDWKNLLIAYTREREETCFLFGQKVSETPIELLSPRTFPYESDK
jgi:tetratricopeptide (TPR) repeat protein